MPPLAPPYGKLTIAHLRVIKQAKAYTYSISTLSAKRVPPFVGNL